jgi:predicted MFS family arabinose efflux permease
MRNQPFAADSQAPGDSPLLVLRNRKFLYLWLAQVLTQIGANMVLFGLTVQVFSISEPGFRNTAVSLLILSFLVPAVVFGAIAGVYVDRLERRIVLVISNLVRAAAFVVLLFVGDHLALIYLLTIVIATATTFFGPAEAAMIPVLVVRRQLLAANSLYIFTLQAAFFVGFAVLGPLVINLAGHSVLLVVVAALFVLAGLLCWLLPAYHPQLGVSRPAQALGEAGSAVATTFGQLRDGLVFIGANRTVFWPLTYLAITASLVGVLGVLGPGYATDTLGLTERDFVVVVLPLGMGLVTGVLALNVYGKYFSRRRGIEGGLFAIGLALVVLAIAQPVTSALDLGPLVSLLSVVVAVAFAAGIAYAFVAVPAQTQLQEELPPGIRGRVFGVLNMLISIASFLPIVIVGPIADLVGPGPVLQGVALFILASAVGSVLWAQPTREPSGPAGLVEPVDPVAISGRSLTQPIALAYVDDDESGGLSYVASPVLPGRAGPASVEEVEEPAGDTADSPTLWNGIDDGQDRR